MSARLYDVVMELPVRWADNRRIFIISGTPGQILARLEIEGNAVDDVVLDAIEYLRETLGTAQRAASPTGPLSLVKDP